MFRKSGGREKPVLLNQPNQGGNLLYEKEFLPGKKEKDLGTVKEKKTKRENDQEANALRPTPRKKRKGRSPSHTI